MGSWQSEMEDFVLNGFFSQGAVFSAAGNSVWADTSDFNVTPEELRTIIGAYSDSSAVQANGFHVAGHKYVYVGHDDRTLMGGSSSSIRTGVICTKTKTAIIVGKYEGVPRYKASKAIEALADFQISNNR